MKPKLEYANWPGRRGAPSGCMSPTSRQHIIALSVEISRRLRPETGRLADLGAGRLLARIAGQAKKQQTTLMMTMSRVKAKGRSTNI